MRRNCAMLAHHGEHVFKDAPFWHKTSINTMLMHFALDVVSFMP
jgi:hypothetical protein